MGALRTAAALWIGVTCMALNSGCGHKSFVLERLGQIKPTAIVRIVLPHEDGAENSFEINLAPGETSAGAIIRTHMEPQYYFLFEVLKVGADTATLRISATASGKTIHSQAIGRKGRWVETSIGHGSKARVLLKM